MSTSLKIGDISFGIAASFLFGVFIANMHWNILLLATIECLTWCAIIFFDHSHTSWKYALFFVFATIVGAIYYSAYIHWQAIRTNIPNGKSTAFFGIVTDEPKAAGDFTMLIISLSRPYAGTVDIFTSPGNQFSYGDELWISGSVESSKDAGESPALFLPRLHLIARHNGIWIKEVTIDLKAWIVQRITQALPEDEAALLSGIMVGTTGAMSTSLKAGMETSGTSYIVGMYGYKIAILTFTLAAALKDHLSRRSLLLLTLMVVMLFVVASGGSISAIRAAIMGSFAVIARGMGKTFSARNSITFAATGMVLINATLLTDAAFQLSFLSFLGIYYLGPPINNYFRWTGEGALQWRSHAMLSLSTNLAILPIVMSTFGEFSLTSFISNIFIMIPWVAVIAFGALMICSGLISPYLAFCATQIVNILLQYELYIIHLFSVMTIPMPAIFNSILAITLYYGTLIIFAYYYAPASQKDN